MRLRTAIALVALAAVAGSCVRRAAIAEFRDAELPITLEVMNYSDQPAHLWVGMAGGTVHDLGTLRPKKAARIALYPDALAPGRTGYFVADVAGQKQLFGPMYAAPGAFITLKIQPAASPERPRRAIAD